MQQILFVGPSDQVDDKKFVGPSGISPQSRFEKRVHLVYFMTPREHMGLLIPFVSSTGMGDV